MLNSARAIMTSEAGVPKFVPSKQAREQGQLSPLTQSGPG